MSAPRFGVQAGLFGECIYVGSLNSNGTVFTKKENCTDMVLAAVAQYVIDNFDGGLWVEFPHLNGGVRMAVAVKPLDNDGSEKS